MQKLFKRSANDEKWRDCFYIMISNKTSASGEVEARQNMAELIQIGIFSIFRIWSVSDLDKME